MQQQQKMFVKNILWLEKIVEDAKEAIFFYIMQNNFLVPYKPLNQGHHLKKMVCMEEKERK